MRKEFDWEEFINDRILVHCKTEEEAVDFFKKCEKNKEIKRLKMSSKKTYWECCKERTCYNVSGKVLMYSPKEHYKNYGYKIIEWSDYMNNKEFSKSSLVELNAIILRNNESRWLN